MASPRTPALTELLGRCAHGDEEAFAQLYDQTVSRVYGAALRVVRDPSLADEVTQEAYLQVWRGASSFDGSSSGWGWIMAIAHRRAVDAVRSTQAARRRDELYARDGRGATAPGADAELVLEDERARVRSCLDSLTAVQRPALEMAYWQGLTHTQIAGELGVALGTIKSRLRDGLRRLATCLEGSEERTS